MFYIYLIYSFQVLGRCDKPFLGCGSVCDLPTYGWCVWKYRRFWFLRWVKRLCIRHDFLPDAWYGRISFIIHHSFSYNCFKFCIETKQRTLEELDYVFAVPTSRHISYQARTFLPYWIQRYVFFRKVELKPLYNFDEVESITVFEKGTGH